MRHFLYDPIRQVTYVIITSFFVYYLEHFPITCNVSKVYFNVSCCNILLLFSRFVGIYDVHAKICHVFADSITFKQIYYSFLRMEGKQGAFCSAFLCRQSLHCSLSRADLHLPKSPDRKAEIIQRLGTKNKLRINSQVNRGRPHKELIDKEKIWLIAFLDRSDIFYTNPGHKNHIYIGKFDGESKYKQKQYLLQP